MIKVAQNEIQSVLLQLDQAIYSHHQWYSAITRTLICRLPHDLRDGAKEAHRQCIFGQWYYGVAPDTLRVHPGFIAIGIEHKNVHRLAAQLLQTSASGATISSLDYDGFVNVLERLRLQLYTLKHELEEVLYNLDPLTGADNRIGMLTKLREQQEMVKRHVEACCIVMMDIDHFKAINDTHGHIVGDMVLAASAHNVMEHLRPYDKLFRYGGEEFLICMPNTEMSAGYEVVERVRLGLAANRIDYGSKEPLQITMSFGVTLLDPDVSVEQSIERADKAMYAAKTAGRNCTRTWNPAM